MKRIEAPKRSDCIVWALVRLYRKGGYVVFRQSFYSRWIIHAMWTRGEGSVWWGYSPLPELATAPRWLKVLRWLRTPVWLADRLVAVWLIVTSIWFRGRVIMGDKAAIAAEADRIILARAEEARIVLAARGDAG